MISLYVLERAAQQYAGDMKLDIQSVLLLSYNATTETAEFCNRYLGIIHDIRAYHIDENGNIESVTP